MTVVNQKCILVDGNNMPELLDKVNSLIKDSTPEYTKIQYLPGSQAIVQMMVSEDTND